MSDKRGAPFPLPIDDFGGGTEAHYLPVEPRAPAPEALKRTIAEQFQDILWQAFQAGAACGEATREAFEGWYQRGVLDT